MIIFSPVVMNLLAQPAIEVYYMVRIGPSGLQETFRSTTFFSDIQLKDGGAVVETYENNDVTPCKLLKIDPPEMSSSVDRQQYKLYIADPDFTKGGELSSYWISKSAEIRLGFINVTQENIIDSSGNSVAPGRPFQDVRDTIVVYAGVIDSAGYQISTQEIGEVVGVLTCSSPMYSLDMKKYLVLNRDSIRAKYPEDSCCDYVLIGSESVKMQWGKGGNTR
jgi:hypothetical protein